ncbi:TonB-dependent receptor [Pseudobacter ginsenosidimutans]|uniref:Iron complex outermembrane receptor protein n=1 Tax=Pseudobacter ginsenosidimutans TaxID=661488 RepID=A0A4V2F1V5_9BACT|nr:TonB-dependent receptor [Pseudobacter ginsenosidimutans]RZS75096.1 iron complex outermembrane receptor protein [Pseudobacter ginsenosidimutans]
MRFLVWLLAALPLFSFGNINSNEPDFGIIKGQVTTSDNKPATFVTVSLKGTKRSVVTEDDGSFIIQKVKPGTYQLEVTLVGYDPLVQEVTVGNNQTTALNLQLNVSSVQLTEVIVVHAKNRFATKRTETVARMPLRNLENPQVYNVVAQSLITEQIATERTDIFRNVPGAVPNFAAGGSQGLTMRGFQNTQGTRNGLATSAIAPMNPAILDRIEFIKGPVGTVFGGGRGITFGGTYNYVTKKPYDHFGGEISYTTGSYAFNRIQADVNTPLTIKGKQNAYFRIVGAYQSEGTFQDQGFAKNYTIAPSFRYEVNDKLTFNIEAEITRGNYTTTSFALDTLEKFSARSMKDIPIGYKQSLINNSLDINNGINNVQAQIEYKISNKWKSQTNFLYSEGFYKDFLWTTLTLLSDSTVARSTRNQTPETFGNIQAQQNFIGDFLIGKFRNRVVVGFDYNYNYNDLYRVTVPVDTVNFRKATIANYSADKVNVLSQQRGFGASKTKSSTYSVYLSDLFNITPELMAMVSLRMDRFNTEGTFNPATGKYTGAYNQTSWSPKFGLVYQPVKDRVSIFGNYMTGFLNQAPAAQPDGSTLILKPQYGNQLEGGVKLELFRNKLTGSISVYDISVTNSTRNETIGGKIFTVQDGTQQSRGVEVELIAAPVSGLNIIAGYAFNENKYKKASAALTGKYVTASPKNTANLWVSYTLLKGNLKGFGIGAGANYVDDSWYESRNLFVLPSYTLVNATVFYDQPAYRISVKANNLLNEEYWNSNGIAQKPSNFLVSLGLKF